MRPISRRTMSDVYLWETYDKLGREALDSGDLEQANEAFRSAIATAEEIQAHDRLVLSLRNLAATMQDMNQMADAHELLVRTLDVAQQQLGNEHSQTVETLRDLSQLSQQLGYLDKADALLKQVLEQDIKSQSADRIGSTLLSLARLAQARNEPAVAAAYLQRVVKLNRQKHGDNHPEVAQSLLWLATALYQCGKNDEAQSFMRTAFGLMERHFGNEPMHLAQSLLAGAKLMVDAGQLEPALVHQKRALDLLSQELEPENERLWETREYIATTLAAMGKLEEAIEILEYCFRHGNPQGARAGAILPFTSATASLCAAVTVAVVEVLPLLPNLVAQSATAVVFPLFGSLVAAAASVSKARCEVDAEAATAAANELSSVDGDEPINPIGSTVELTRLAVRPILSNLRPRKLWRNIRRKKQD